jgi:hypothetical protein
VIHTAATTRNPTMMTRRVPSTRSSVGGAVTIEG